MRMRYQAQAYRENQTQIAMREARIRRESVGEEVHQAATMAGEVIARLNNHKTTKVEDVIKHYKPDFIERDQQK